MDKEVMGRQPPYFLSKCLYSLQVIKETDLGPKFSVGAENH